MVTLEELVGMITVPIQNIIKAEAAKSMADSRALLEKIFENDFNTFEEFLKEKDYVRSEDREGLTADDVPEELKVEIAYAYMRENPSDSLNVAFGYASDTIIKHKVVEYIKDNL